MKPILVILSFMFLACYQKNEPNKVKEQYKGEKIETNIKYKKIEAIPIDSITSRKLDRILDNNFCDNEFCYYNGSFYYPDYGCSFSPSSPSKNNLGDISVFLIPKQSVINSNSSDDFIEKETKKLNNSSIKEIKEKYYIVIFLIEAKYLTNTAEGYYQEMPYIEKYIRYNSDIKKWELLDMFHISNSDEEQKIWQKETKIIDSIRATLQNQQ